MGSCAGVRSSRGQRSVARRRVDRQSDDGDQRAITVDAPPDAIWPWLVQVRTVGLTATTGSNLFGCSSTCRSDHPRVARLGVGDQIRAAPERAGPEAGFTVVRHARSIVTVVGDPARVVAPPSQDHSRMHGLCAPHRRPPDQIDRALPRPVGDAQALRVDRFAAAEPVHFVMERKQLLGVSACTRGNLTTWWGRPTFVCGQQPLGRSKCRRMRQCRLRGLRRRDRRKPAPMLADYANSSATVGAGRCVGRCCRRRDRDVARGGPSLRRQRRRAPRGARTRCRRGIAAGRRSHRPRERLGSGCTPTRR